MAQIRGGQGVGLFVKGQVVKVLFPFSDLTGSKKRPGFVVANLHGDDTLLCQITSQNDDQDPYAIPLNSSDFEDGSLRQPSFIRPSKLFTADSAIISEVIGYVNPGKANEIEQAIIRIVQSGHSR
jgi:mRNA interferase MazF